jgi:hypothetical protein
MGITGTTVDPDTPLRLSEAVKLAYPDGSMTVSGLRTERNRGRLVTEKTAGKEYTTLANIERMRELCRSDQKGRDCGLSPPDQSRIAAPSGASETVKSNAALALARDKLSKLRERLPTTSSQNHPPRAPATVTRLKSGSLT